MNSPSNAKSSQLANAASHYLHGTDPTEQTRLSRLNDLLNPASIREMQLSGCKRILDVGSGLGQFTRTMAEAAGIGAYILGIERSPEQLAEAKRLASLAPENIAVEFRHGEATALPLSDDEWNSFDLAHARFLLEHVRDPLAVVRQLVRAVRPGGRIVLQDDGHDVLRLSPPIPAFDRLWTAYIRSYELVGNDPYIGHRLVSLLWQAGAEPTRNTWLSYASCAGEPDLLQAHVENLAHIVQGVREVILDHGILDSTTFDEGLAALRDWSARPDAAFWYAFSWAEGRKKDATI